MPRIADRKNELDLFDAILAGRTAERILFIRAFSEGGKTILLTKFATHAEGVLGRETCARVNLKAGPPLFMILERICQDLGPGGFPKFGTCQKPGRINIDLSKTTLGNQNVLEVKPVIQESAAPTVAELASRLVEDLCSRKTPAVIIIDTYEQATQETSSWILRGLLPIVRKIEHFWVVIAGQNPSIPLPEYHLEWGDLAKIHDLLPVSDPDEWHKYACEQYPNFPRADFDMLCRGLASRPSAIIEYIRNVGPTFVSSGSVVP